MKNKKRASATEVAKSSNPNKNYYITVALAVATIISGWCISGIWDGIATMILFTVLVLMVNDQEVE